MRGLLRGLMRHVEASALGARRILTRLPSMEGDGHVMRIGHTRLFLSPERPLQAGFAQSSLNSCLLSSCGEDEGEEKRRTAARGRFRHKVSAIALP